MTDWAGLLAKGVTWFKETSFSPYGKGPAFAGKILGERVDNANFSMSHLHRIADVLGFPVETKEEELQRYRTILAQHGVIDRATLVARKGSLTWFKRTDFSPYGKGPAFD